MGGSCSTQSCQSYSWVLLPVQFSEIAKNWVDVDLRRPLSAVLHRVSFLSHSPHQRFSRNGLVFTGFNSSWLSLPSAFISVITTSLPSTSIFRILAHCRTQNSNPNQGPINFP